MYSDEHSHKKSVLSSMKKYIDQKQEMDKILEKLIKPIIKSKDLRIIDSGCGMGHIPYILTEINPKLEIVGIDKESYLIKAAKNFCKNKKNISFDVGDINKLHSKFKKEFDIGISWKVISWLPYYEACLKSLFKICKKHIFISSLFYDGDIDFEIKVTQFKRKRGKEFFKQYYNVYSFPKFQKFIRKLGAKKLKAYNFEINVDLPKSSLDKMGTYTLKLKNGKRVQVSGAIVMSWKILRIDL